MRQQATLARLANSGKKTATPSTPSDEG
jgi:hypothetical protein